MEISQHDGLLINSPNTHVIIITDSKEIHFFPRNYILQINLLEKLYSSIRQLNRYYIELQIFILYYKFIILLYNIYYRDGQLYQKIYNYIRIRKWNIWNIWRGVRRKGGIMAKELTRERSIVNQGKQRWMLVNGRLISKRANQSMAYSPGRESCHGRSNVSR